MKKLWLLLIGLSFALFANAAELPQDKVVGEWWTPQKDGRVNIYKEDGKYFGKLVWTTPESADRLDEQNPDPKLRNKKVLGSVILKDFTFEDGAWTDGTIYDPKSGKTYQSNLKIEDGQLKVRGYVGFSWLGRTETFSRYDGQSTTKM